MTFLSFSKLSDSPRPCDVSNAGLQSLTVVSSQFALANLLKGDNSALHLSLQEDDAGLPITTPDEARLTSFAMSLDEQIDLIRDGNGVREDHSCTIWGHVPDEAIYRKALITESNGAAEKRSSTLQLTTFKHRLVSCDESVNTLDPSSSKSFATAGHVSYLSAIKVNCEATSIPLDGATA